MVRQAGAGLVCAPEDPDALARAARQLFEMAPGEREAMGQSGRRAFLAAYTRQALIGRYESLFGAVSQQRRAISANYGGSS